MNRTIRRHPADMYGLARCIEDRGIPRRGLRCGEPNRLVGDIANEANQRRRLANSYLMRPVHMTDPRLQSIDDFAPGGFIF